MAEELSPEVIEERARIMKEEQAVARQEGGSGLALEDQEIWVDSWGYAGTYKSYFPGQERVPEKYKQYIELQKMTEGIRQNYQKATNGKVTIQHDTQNAEMGIDPARDRKALILNSRVGWYLLRRNPKTGEPESIKYSEHEFKVWFEQADPAIIEQLEFDIRENNPWMKADMSLEAVQTEIERLQGVEEDLKRQELEKSLL